MLWETGEPLQVCLSRSKQRPRWLQQMHTRGETLPESAEKGPITFLLSDQAPHSQWDQGRRQDDDV